MNAAPMPDPSGAAPEGTFWKDFSASLVVFLVALPLCMGVAVASGAPVAAGIMTGIIGGLVVGWLAGSPLQVSGPAAGLTVLVYQIASDPTMGMPILGVIVLAAGLIQIGAGLLRLGQWFRAVSPAVIEGMLAGIGVLIFASQFHVMVDDDPKGGGLANLISIPQAMVKAFDSSDATHAEAAQVGLVTIALIVLWKLIGPKRLALVPAPLVAVIGATALALSLQAAGVWPQLRPIVLPERLWDEVNLPSLSTLSRLTERSVVVAVLSMAFIASAETLLCATAVDQMHTGPRTRYDRELTAQGVGNLLCGMVGALPMTGVIVRSATNVQAGAKTRLSAVLHGAWFVVLMVLVPVALKALVPEEVLATWPAWLAALVRTAPWVELVPKAALAAVLVYTGYKLVNVQNIKHLSRYGRGEVVIYLATLTTVVCVDLLVGVLTGIVLSLIKLMYTFSHLNVRLERDPQHGRTVLHIEGAATFVRLPKFAAVLEQVTPATELHVEFDKLTYIDHACLTLLMNWEKQHQALGGSLVIDWDSLHARFRHGPPVGDSRVGEKAVTAPVANGHHEPYAQRNHASR